MDKIDYKFEQDPGFIEELENHSEITSKKEIVSLAKTGSRVGLYLLTRNNLEAVYHEALNPLTREEVAIEMLAELLICPILDIRERAFNLLKKIQPSTISDKLSSENVDDGLKGLIIEMIIAEKDVPLNILVELLQNKSLDSQLEDKLVGYINDIRQRVADTTQKVLSLAIEIKDLQEKSHNKFRLIENFFRQLQSFGTNYPANPKALQDLKLDIEMAFNTLRDAK
jgi:hypothetical protein